jgi:hypothetical protein
MVVGGVILLLFMIGILKTAGGGGEPGGIPVTPFDGSIASNTKKLIFNVPVAATIVKFRASSLAFLLEILSVKSLDFKGPVIALTMLVSYVRAFPLIDK